MKSKFLMYVALFLATTAVWAQKKDITTSKTIQQTVDKRTPAVNAELSETEDSAFQKAQQQKLQENQAKSKAARAERDKISEATRRRLAKSKARKQ